MAVPQRYLMVWIGTEFPYPCRLAAEAVLANAPEAELEIHVVGNPPTTPYFTEMFAPTAPDAARISLHRVDLDRLFEPPVRRVYERIPATARSAQSNLVRLGLLHQRGGIYLDFDTLLLRPLHDLAPGAFVGLERVWRHDRQRVTSGLTPRMIAGATGWGITWALKRGDSQALRGAARSARWLRPIDDLFHVEQANNAVLGAPAHSEFTEQLLDASRFIDPTIRFALGPTLVHDTVAATPRLAKVLPPEVLYPVPPSESHRFFDDRYLALPPSAAIVHYVGSNHARTLASVTPGDRRFGRPTTFWQLGRMMDERRTNAVARVGELERR
ncbi:MAG: glycosyltransferase [Actinomycetota bacterium]|nr:glycosyltransferase [Actinomycetota bacterium]